MELDKEIQELVQNSQHWKKWNTLGVGERRNIIDAATNIVKSRLEKGGPGSGRHKDASGKPIEVGHRVTLNSGPDKNKSGKVLQLHPDGHLQVDIGQGDEAYVHSSEVDNMSKS